MDGNTALGASSPANPALHIPEPLSTTRAATSSSHMISVLFSRNKKIKIKIRLIVDYDDVSETNDEKSIKKNDFFEQIFTFRKVINK